MTPKLKSLKDASVLFETGNHFAEATEEYICEIYKLEKAPPNTEGYDAIKRVGSKIIRVQIKGRSISNKNGIPSPLDSVKPNGFDLMIVLIVKSYEPVGFFELDSEFFYNKAKYRHDESKPGYALTISKAFLKEHLHETPTKNIR